MISCRRHAALLSSASRLTPTLHPLLLWAHPPPCRRRPSRASSMASSTASRQEGVPSCHFQFHALFSRRPTVEHLFALELDDEPTFGPSEGCSESARRLFFFFAVANCLHQLSVQCAVPFCRSGVPGSYWPKCTQNERKFSSAKNHLVVLAA